MANSGKPTIASRRSQDLHSSVFGDEADSKPAPANDENEFGDDAVFERAFADRVGRERRTGGDRRRSERRDRDLDYSPLPDASGGYRPPSDSKRGLLIGAATIIVVAVFGAVVWNAYSAGLKTNEGEPAPQLAESGPFKSRPAAEEKSSITEEARVFDRREASEPASIAPDPTPDVRPAAPAPNPVTQAEAPKIETSQPTKIEPPKPVKAEPPRPTKAETPKTAPTVAAAAQPAKSAPKPAAVAAAAAPALAGGQKRLFAADGAYAVQLAASSTEAGAFAEWDRRVRAAPDLFDGAERLIIRADVNGRTVYRVRAGAFATATDADSFCSAVKARGGDCFRAIK